MKTYQDQILVTVSLAGVSLNGCVGVTHIKPALNLSGPGLGPGPARSALVCLFGLRPHSI